MCSSDLSLEAPTRHPIDWKSPDFYDQEKLEAEMHRVFDICHGCRRCVSLCGSFPTLFDLIDEGKTGELDGMTRDQAIAGATEVMQDPDRALLVHAKEEFGIDPTEMPSAIGAALMSFVMFLLGALLPVIPWYFAEGTGASVTSITIGVVSAAIVGVALGRSTERSLVRTSVRQVVILLLATAATFVIGKALGTQIS